MLKAINDIIWGAKKFKAGESFEVPEDVAKRFIELRWAEAEEAPKKTAKKKK